MNRQQLGGMMDHTVLKATATKEQVAEVCREALLIGAASVCVNPSRVQQVKEALAGSEVKVCTVVGFPLGANTPEVKAFETVDAIAKGAQEIDMVINIGALKDGDMDTVLRDICAVVKAADGTLVKVIIETCYLTDEEKVAVCKLAKEAGADFVKTSTGFGTGGATEADVKLMRETVGSDMQVKASGGMRTYADVVPILAAGADRLGVSASLVILEGFDKAQEK